MRVLLGGLIGAAISVGGWLYLEHTQQAEFGWMAWLVGFLTGLGVYLTTGPNAPGGYARGAMSAILALAAIVGGKYIGGAELAKKLNADTNNAAPVSVQVDDAPDEGDADTTADPVEEPPEVIVADAPDGARATAAKTSRRSFKDEDMLWLCLGAITAYIVGKGRGDGPAVAEAEEGAAPREGDDHGDESEA